MVDTIGRYDIKTMTEELQKLLRIQDWDIVVTIADNLYFLREMQNENVKGYCMRDRAHRSALITLNGDHPQSVIPVGEDYVADGWLSTLIHEFCHVFVDDYSYISEALIDEDERDYKYFDSQLRLQLESMINRTTRMILSMMDVPAFLDRHRKDESDVTDTSEETK